MFLCSSGHDEVCYDSRRCPACDLVEEKILLEDEVKELRKEIEKLENSHD